MSVLSAEEVADIARLARLALSAEEIERLRHELAAILKNMEALSELDAAGVSPMTHAVPMTLRFRDDSPRESLDRERVFAAAPAIVEDCFEVPSILPRDGSES